MYDARSPLGLIGSHINAQTGQWTHTDTSVGGWIDSFYEYLAKSFIAFNDKDAGEMFEDVCAVC
jgi:hypothetical protein